MEKLRENNFDLLRILACLAVIGIHASAPYIVSVSDSTIFGDFYRRNMFSTVLWNTLTRFAVPCFVMLSGAFVLSDSKNKNCGYFYKKTFKKIVIPFFLFSFLYLFWGIVKNIIRGENILSPIFSFLSGSPATMFWYLWMLVGLYFLVPLLLVFKDYVGEYKFKKIAVLLLFLTFPGNWGSRFNIQYSIGLSAEYLGYFMVGYLIRNESRKPNKYIYIYI